MLLLAINPLCPMRHLQMPKYIQLFTFLNGRKTFNLEGRAVEPFTFLNYWKEGQEVESLRDATEPDRYDRAQPLDRLPVSKQSMQEEAPNGVNPDVRCFETRWEPIALNARHSEWIGHTNLHYLFHQGWLLQHSHQRPPRPPREKGTNPYTTPIGKRIQL